MIQSPASALHYPMMLVEAVFALLSLGLCVAWPRLGASWFARIEKAFAKLAKRKRLSVVVVGATALLLRLAVLPLCPIPSPFAPDDFSFLLASDTFAHGRLTNPTPAMWTHFESLHITMLPSYMTMYFPAQGLVLAAGKILLGNPWFGLLVVTALMCAAICWMLQAWLPPTWALLGGMVAVLRLGLFSYWINTYTGAGSVAALGGALVLGAFPRIMRTSRRRDFLALSLGIILLLMCRPYEGFLLCFPVAFVLVRWLASGKNRPSPRLLLGRSALPLALIVIAIMWLGYYDQRNFQNPLTLPYTINRATYAVAPYWIWQHPKAEPIYHHKEMRDFYIGEEAVAAQYQTPLRFAIITLFKPIVALQFFAGITFVPTLIMARRVLLDRRIRFFILSGIVWAAGMSIAIFLLPHYLAPFTAAFYVLGLQCMRHLRVWRLGQLPVGSGIVRFAIVSCLALAVLRTGAEPLHLTVAAWPGAKWVSDWYGPGQFGATRDKVQKELEHAPGKQLVLVRYSKDHDAIEEWVYNAADIDGSKVIWAREMNAANNDELIHYYRDRSVWLIQPDQYPVSLLPYPMPKTVTGPLSQDSR